MVRYSFNDLLAANNVIDSFIPKLDAETGKLRELPEEKASLFKGEVVQTCVDSKNNRVIVWLDDISQESINDFYKNISDAPFLKFELAPKSRPKFQTSYKSGEGWVNGIGSIGFPATFGSETGFVTAYHCTVSGVNTINGQDYGVRLYGSSIYDYAFIRQQYSSISISRDLYGSSKSLSSSIRTYLTQGSQVGRTGYVTGFQTGTVAALHVGDCLGSDLVATTCVSDYGDSGGPYFDPSSSSVFSIVGIHIGSCVIGDMPVSLYRDVGYLYDAGIRIG